MNTILILASGAMIPFCFQRILREAALAISLLIVCVFLALRYNYGNDYSVYFDMFYNGSLRSYIEPGYEFLVWLFKPFGFFSFVACITIFNIVVLFIFIRKYVARQVQFIAVLVYILSYNLMLVQASAIRQSLAISICMIAAMCIVDNRKWYFTAALLLLASLFHQSALVLLPFFLVINYFCGKSISSLKILLVNLVVILLLPLFVIPAVFALAPMLLKGDDFRLYTDNLTGGEVASGMGIVLSVTIYVYGWIVMDRSTRLSRFLLLSYQMQIFLICAGIYFSALARFSMFFEIYSVAYVPLLLKRTKDWRLAVCWFLIIISFICYQLVTFFNSYVWQDGFATYKTIFSAHLIGY